MMQALQQRREEEGEQERQIGKLLDGERPNGEHVSEKGAVDVDQRLYGQKQKE